MCVKLTFACSRLCKTFLTHSHICDIYNSRETTHLSGRLLPPWLLWQWRLTRTCCWHTDWRQGTQPAPSCCWNSAPAASPPTPKLGHRRPDTGGPLPSSHPAEPIRELHFKITIPINQWNFFYTISFNNSENLRTFNNIHLNRRILF